MEKRKTQNPGSPAVRAASIVPRPKQFFDFKSNWQLYAMVAIPVIFLIIFAYIPMGGLTLAFKDYSVKKGIFSSPWVGLKHFENFLGSPIFLNIFWNTVILSLYQFFAGFFIPIVLAVFMNELINPFAKKASQMITFFPYLISVVVMTGMLLQFFSPNGGLVNNTIALFGGETRDFMADPTLFRHLYVWSGVWQTAGYSAVIYIAALAGVDPQMTESAILDGATRIKKIWYIYLPTIAPTITIMLILGIGGIMSIGYEKAYLMQNNLNLDVSEIISTYIYKRGLVKFQFSYSTAIGFFNSVVNVVLLVVANTMSRRFSETSLW